MVRTAPRFVAYLRVSTDQQGRSGLGLEAQRTAAERHVASVGGRIVAEFVEVEGGKKNDRPEVAAALAACRKRHATLLIAKLDRLARDAEFLLSIVNGSGERGVLFCDLPRVPEGPVGKFLVTQMAAVAELEAGLISERTKAALAAAKERRKKEGKPPLGGHRANSCDVRPYAKQGGAASGAVRREKAEARAADLAPVVEELRAAGATTLRQIAAGLNEQGVRTARGREWTAMQVSRVLARMEAA